MVNKHFVFLTILIAGCTSSELPQSTVPQNSSVNKSASDPSTRTTPSQPFWGVVTQITDGDTIVIRDDQEKEWKVRLVGIAAPKGDQPFSEESTKALEEKVSQNVVDVEWSDRDKSDRILGTILYHERNINKELVAEGFAWHFKKYSDDAELASAEVEARNAKVGLWAGEPISPWDFREQKRLAEQRREREDEERRLAAIAEKKNQERAKAKQNSALPKQKEKDFGKVSATKTTPTIRIESGIKPVKGSKPKSMTILKIEKKK